MSVAMKSPVVLLFSGRGVRGGAGAARTIRLRLTAGSTVTGGGKFAGNSSAAPSVESENDREFCGAAGAMLTRRSGSRAIGSPPSASSASINSIGT